MMCQTIFFIQKLIVGKTWLLSYKNMIVVFSSKNLFSNRFDSKYPGNTLKALLNQSIASKNTKKTTLKHKINPKKSSWAHVVCRCFQGKITLNLNPPHYMEQFDLMVEIITNNNFLSLRRNLATPLSLFHQKRTEK